MASVSGLGVRTVRLWRVPVEGEADPSARVWAEVILTHAAGYRERASDTDGTEVRTRPQAMTG